MWECKYPHQCSSWAHMRKWNRMCPCLNLNIRAITAVTIKCDQCHRLIQQRMPNQSQIQDIWSIEKCKEHLFSKGTNKWHIPRQCPILFCFSFNFPSWLFSVVIMNTGSRLAVASMDHVCSSVVEMRERITRTEGFELTDGHAYTQGGFILKHFTSSERHRKSRTVVKCHTNCKM